MTPGVDPAQNPLFEGATYNTAFERAQINPKPLVILESPFAGDVEKNIAYAKRAIQDCLARGEAPIASHLLLTQPGILDDNDPVQREIGIEAGLAWYRAAQLCVVYEDLGISNGMRAGMTRAIQQGVPVIFRTLGSDQ